MMQFKYEMILARARCVGAGLGILVRACALLLWKGLIIPSKQAMEQIVQPTKMEHRLTIFVKNVNTHKALDMKCYFKVRSLYHTKRKYIPSRLWPTNFSEPMNIQNRWNNVTSAACLALRRESRGDLVFSKSQDRQTRELSLALLHDGDVPGYWFNDGDVLWPPSTTIQREVILCRRRSTQLYTF